MAEVEPQHTGLIREDMLLLRYIFGLPQDPSVESPPLQSLISLPELENTSIKDVVLIAFDTEVPLVRRGNIDLVRRFQVGVSIFDTRSLLPILVAAESFSGFEQQIDNTLQTYNFCSGGAEYCAKASRRFLFGESEKILSNQIGPKLEELIPMDRKVVLVVHGGYQDLCFLKEVEIDLHPVCTIDTQKAAQTALRLTRRYSLEKLLAVLSCPFKYLHTAGNDANFTLRVLFMIAVKDSQNEAPPDDCPRSLLSTLQAIAQSTKFKSTVWLDKQDEEDWVAAEEAVFGTLEERQSKNRRKKAKKLEKTRKK